MHNTCNYVNQSVLEKLFKINILLEKLFKINILLGVLQCELLHRELLLSANCPVRHSGGKRLISNLSMHLNCSIQEQLFI